MSRKIMIFDDEEDVLFICKIKLEMLGYSVTTEKTVVNVTREVRETMPDLIIMDNWIPDIGGVAATKLIKKSPDLQHIPVILCTASKDIQELTQQAGADGSLEKPFDLNHLAALISNCLGIALHPTQTEKQK